MSHKFKVGDKVRIKDVAGHRSALAKQNRGKTATVTRVFEHNHPVTSPGDRFAIDLSLGGFGVWPEEIELVARKTLARHDRVNVYGPVLTGAACPSGTSACIRRGTVVDTHKPPKDEMDLHEHDCKKGPWVSVRLDDGTCGVVSPKQLRRLKKKEKKS